MTSDLPSGTATAKTNDVNLLMARLDEINSITDPTMLTPGDIQDLIAIHRRNRARKAAGEKLLTSRPADGPTVDLMGLLNLAPAKPATTNAPMTRRI